MKLVKELDVQRIDAYRSIVAHVLAMADDAYLMGHPEWCEIVKEARALLK